MTMIQGTKTLSAPTSLWSSMVIVLFHPSLALAFHGQCESSPPVTPFVSSFHSRIIFWWGLRTNCWRSSSMFPGRRGRLGNARGLTGKGRAFDAVGECAWVRTERRLACP